MCLVMVTIVENHNHPQTAMVTRHAPFAKGTGKVRRTDEVKNTF